MSRWNRCEDNPPTKNGRYWVYPYRTLGGYLVVSMGRFENGKWETTSSEQEFTHWKKIEVPEAPKGSSDMFTNTRDCTVNDLLYDLRRNPDRRRK